MEHQLYTYKAHVTDVYDGDTITVDVDLGMNIWIRGLKLRLYGINTPEIRGPEREAGLIATAFVKALIEDGEVVITTVKDKTGKYGRMLATVYYRNVDGSYTNLNEELLEKGMAKELTY